MATKISIRAVTVPRLGLVWPGSLFDTTNDAADVALIEASGGVLADASSELLEASSRAQAMHRRGRPAEEAESVMQSAVDVAQAEALGEQEAAVAEAEEAIAEAEAAAEAAEAAIAAAQEAITEVQAAIAGGAQPVVFPFHETLFAPAAPGTAVGAIGENEASASPSALLGHPRTLAVTFPADWQGGNVVVVGKDVRGAAVQQTFLAAPGTTVQGNNVFASVDDGGITNTIQGGTSDEATVATGVSLGIACPANGNVQFLRLSADGVGEEFASTDASRGSFRPTTAPDGATVFEVWFVAEHAHAIGS